MEQKKRTEILKIHDPARIRTWNPLIRSQMPYPLGHGAFMRGRYFHATKHLSLVMMKRLEQTHNKEG